MPKDSGKLLGALLVNLVGLLATALVWYASDYAPRAVMVGGLFYLGALYLGIGWIKEQIDEKRNTQAPPK